ncbi:MAG TPA: glycosyltransferase family 39 protein [Usitatibacter sp.]|jgi:hypothetical protein|nr:glycosyltransferase family 39 protein [Usitatibacter sp.]
MERGDRLACGAIALAAVVAIVSAGPRLALPPSWDASHVYLPMARELLAKGLAFFALPESVRMPPVAYAYPALLGAHEHLVRAANLGLFAGIVVLLAAAAWTHSRRAAVATAFLAALSPLLRLWIPDVMTEAPFLVLIATWLFAVSRIARGGRIGWVVAAGAAFALASLTRPAASLFAPAAAGVLALRAWRAPDEASRAVESRLALAHGLATAGWLAWLAHNAWRFGFPAIASGAGTALWLGTNPLTDGFDPLYFGLGYDDGSIARDMDHLSIAGDRLLWRAGVLQLMDLPAPALLGMIARKALAFAFVTPYEVPGASPAWMCAWRIALVVLALVAVLRQPRCPLVLAAASFAGYMLVVHLPLLYTLRYSVGALDVPLTLLAGIGAAECASRAWAAAAGLIVAAGIAIGWPAMARTGPAAPRTTDAILEPLWVRDAATLDFRLEHAARTGARTFLLQPGAALEVDVRDAPGFRPWIVTLATLDMAVSRLSRGGRCRDLQVLFRGMDTPTFDRDRIVRVPLEADGTRHRVALGTTQPLGLTREGVLRLEFDCPVAATLEIGTMRVSASVRGLAFHDRMQAAMHATKER